MIRSLLYKIREVKSSIFRAIIRVCYTDSQFTLGKQLKVDDIPTITITDSAVLKIGNNVTLRKGIEIRAHKHSVIEIGDNCRIDRGVRILATNNAHIKLADGVRIGLHSVMNGGDSISIGKKSLVSGFVYLQSSMHNHSSTSSIQDQGYSHKPIVLGDDSWLGAHVTILPGTILGNGCVVGSNAVVTKSFGPNSVIAGVPAKVISNREKA